MFDWSESNITTAEYFSHFVFSCWLPVQWIPSENRVLSSCQTVIKSSSAFFFFLHSGFYFILFIFSGTFVLYVKWYSRDEQRELPEVSVSSLDKLMEIEWKDNKISAAAIEIKTQQNKLKHVVAESDQVWGLLQVLKCSRKLPRSIGKSFRTETYTVPVADPKFVETTEIILINVEAGKVNREYWWIREMQIDKADGTLCVWGLCHRAFCDYVLDFEDLQRFAWFTSFWTLKFKNSSSNKTFKFKTLIHWAVKFPKIWKLYRFDRFCLLQKLTFKIEVQTRHLGSKLWSYIFKL